jgi:hypothetical protein
MMPRRKEWRIVMGKRMERNGLWLMDHGTW